ncbi:MAG TPA: potassium channel protein [Acidimicrobiales bacterium]|nr:potassium channel protein [Acidimicrobiales bacterium]
MAWGIGLLTLILVVGSVGYVILGFGTLDAVYQTVTTITTVGFREVEPLDSNGKIFTIVIILAGVGTALYTLTVLLELLVEGHVGQVVERRRMDKKIAGFRGHVIVCGWGRVGRAIARELTLGGKQVVIVEEDPQRISTVRDYPYVQGDAADDDVLRQAGIEHAAALVAAVATDATNLYITLSGRSLRPDLFIVARAREESSAPKLERAGADRVVNPQEIGGARMAAFLVQPNVTEFLDVVMHDREMELRLEEIEVAPDSPLAGISVAQAAVRDRTGALILAVRDPQRGFVTTPDAGTVMQPGQVLIAIGTSTQLAALASAASRVGSP